MAEGDKGDFIRGVELFIVVSVKERRWCGIMMSGAS